MISAQEHYFANAKGKSNVSLFDQLNSWDLIDSKGQMHKNLGNCNG